ncbi:MAG: hypothetical protein ABIN97_17705 [Ginsengibacter sp.]
MQIIEQIIPEQNEGWFSNTEEVVKKENPAAATELYNLARKRLLAVSQWNLLDIKMLAEFKLADKNGDKITRPVKNGDFFKIKAGAPSSDAGEGYDWVQVEKVDELNNEYKDEQITFIIVHPSSNPTIKTNDVAHFFTSEASSCFVVYREKNIVTAAVYGRNEKPNTETDNLLDKARNAIVAIGAFAGFAKLQWKTLVKGLVS